MALKIFTFHIISNFLNKQIYLDVSIKEKLYKLRQPKSSKTMRVLEGKIVIIL